MRRAQAVRHLVGLVLTCAGILASPGAAGAQVPPLVGDTLKTVQDVATAVTDTVGSLVPEAPPMSPSPAPTPDPSANLGAVATSVPARKAAPEGIELAAPTLPRPARAVRPQTTRATPPARRRRIATRPSATPRATPPAPVRRHTGPAAPARPPSPAPLTRLFAAVPVWMKALLIAVSLALAVALAGVLHSRRRLAAALQRAYRDPVTGLANRAAADDGLVRMAAQARRTGQPLSVVMLDLDRFKTINDTFGHQCGDAVLAAAGRAVATSLRGGDFVARYGGEELIAILPDTDLPRAAHVAEKLRGALSETDHGIDHPVTASFGVAAASGAIDVADLLARTDAALYRAKENGRNRVECDEPGHAVELATV